MRLDIRGSFALTMALALLPAISARAANPSAAQALKLTPIQDDVDYETPPAEAIEKCEIEAIKEGKQSGWMVRDGDGMILRKFCDTNGDNVVDQWSYYKDGLEVYRDIDATFNGKADQYRWFNTAGTRWGIDQNEDGRIDQWRIISAEEVSAEVVSALKGRDVPRFQTLLLTKEELADLGLGEEQTKQIADKIAAASEAFRDLAARQKIVGPQTKFVHFGGSKPGIVPAGTGDSTKDVMVYENVDALIETDGKSQQVHVGTLVRVGNVWRLIDVPKFDGDANVAGSGYFFQVAAARPAIGENAAPSGPTAETQKILAELEQLDRQIAQAPQNRLPQLNAARADLLEKLAIQATDAAGRGQWIRQIADTVGAAVQTGGYPDGVARLESLEKSLAQSGDKALLAYVRFRRMTAAYGQSVQQPKADFAKIQEQWLKDLEAFVNEHSNSPDAAEAMLQLAIAKEFSGDDDEAQSWYGRIVRTFPNTAAARKSKGALMRLGSIGGRIDLRGTNLADGKPLDLAAYKNRVVLVQYWASWCEPCKADMAQIKEMGTKYGRAGFNVIGVNLDHNRADAVAIIKEQRLPWPVLYEEGGLESRLANEMGILTLPTMILVDQQGKVVSRNLHITELEAELKKLLR